MKGCSGFGRRETVAAHPELGAASIFERLVPNGRHEAGTINYSSFRPHRDDDRQQRVECDLDCAATGLKQNVDNRLHALHQILIGGW